MLIQEGIFNGPGARNTNGPARPERPPAAPRPLLAILGAGVLAIAVVLAVIWLWTPPRLPIENAGRAADVPVKDGAVIRFSHDFAERAGVTTAPARLRTMSPRVRAIGTTASDSGRFASVGPRIPGRIRRVLINVGSHVAAGDPLAEIDSAELGQAQARWMGARARERAAWAQMQRRERSDDTKTDVDRASAASTHDASRAERLATEHAIRAMGGETQGDPGVITLRSPISGQVTAARGLRGQAVKPSEDLFDVVDLDTVSVVLDVFEKDIANVRVGDVAKIVAQAATAGRVTGKVQHVGDVIDRDARTAPVRVTVDNRAGVLRLGQSVTAQIETHARAVDVVSVPLQAITEVDGQAALFVAVDDGTVDLREVTTGPEDGTHIEILEGLGVDERVVVGGAFAIKTELFH